MGNNSAINRYDLEAFNIVPKNDFIFIKDVKLEEKQGGLVLPGNVQDNTNQATVIAVGEGFPNGRVVPLKKGDVVIYNTHAGTMINTTDRDNVYKLIHYHDIFALIEKKSKKSEGNNG